VTAGQSFIYHYTGYVLFSFVKYL